MARRTVRRDKLVLVGIALTSILLIWRLFALFQTLEQNKPYSTTDPPSVSVEHKHMVTPAPTELAGDLETESPRFTPQPTVFQTHRVEPETAEPLVRECVLSEEIDDDMMKTMRKFVSASDGSFCVHKMEKLNPRLPFRNVNDYCPKNRRRWFTVLEHYNHIHEEEIENRKRIVHYLAAVCPPPKSTMKFFVDLGAGRLDHSIAWFLRKYPSANEFLIHAVDWDMQKLADPEYKKLPAEKHWLHHNVPWNETGFVTIVHDRAPPAGNETRSPVNTLLEDRPKDMFFNYFDSTPEEAKKKHGLPASLDLKRIEVVKSLDIGSFLVREFKTTDFVVMRMDVNGNEWMLIDRLMLSGTFKLVDELFLVCHNVEVNILWPSDVTPSDCQRLINTLRKGGVYVHEWYD